MRIIFSLAAIALTLTVAALRASVGVACNSAVCVQQDKHSFTRGQCEAYSDGSGAKGIAHGNGPGSNAYASAETVGIANATAGRHSAATAYASDSGIGKAISDSKSLSTATADGGHAKAVSSSSGNAQALAS